MTPTVGRIIHIRGIDRCLAAIITGNIVGLYSATAKPEEPDAWRFNATIFSVRSDVLMTARLTTRHCQCCGRRLWHFWRGSLGWLHCFGCD